MLVYFLFIIYQVIAAIFDKERHIIVENDKVSSIIVVACRGNTATGTILEVAKTSTAAA